MSHYLVAYDVVENKRRVNVAKYIYGYALGGQKSALEVPVTLSEAKEIADELASKIDIETDRINIIQVAPKAILLGTASQIIYDEGMLLL